MRSTPERGQPGELLVFAPASWERPFVVNRWEFQVITSTETDSSGRPVLNGKRGYLLSLLYFLGRMTGGMVRESAGSLTKKCNGIMAREAVLDALEDWRKCGFITTAPPKSTAAWVQLNLKRIQAAIYQIDSLPGVISDEETAKVEQIVISKIRHDGLAHVENSSSHVENSTCHVENSTSLKKSVNQKSSRSKEEADRQTFFNEKSKTGDELGARVAATCEKLEICFDLDGASEYSGPVANLIRLAESRGKNDYALWAAVERVSRKQRVTERLPIVDKPWAWILTCVSNEVRGEAKPAKVPQRARQAAKFAPAVERGSDMFGSGSERSGRPLRAAQILQQMKNIG